MSNRRGAINYTSGSLARGKAKGKNKKSKSHDRRTETKRKLPTALFPPKTQLESRGGGPQKQSEEEPTHDGPVEPEVNVGSGQERTERELLLESDLAVARRAGEYEGIVLKPSGYWWDSFRAQCGEADKFERRVETRSNANRPTVFQSANARGSKVDSNVSGGADLSERSAVCALFVRKNFLDIPSWWTSVNQEPTKGQARGFGSPESGPHNHSP